MSCSSSATQTSVGFRAAKHVGHGISAGPVLRLFDDDVAQVEGVSVVTPSPVVAFQVNWALTVP
jgi:hypothetical protein